MGIAKHLRIEGRVQGVGFRLQMQSRARELGLAGWVRNRGDGSVEAVVYAEHMQEIDAIINWARSGVRLANVTNIEISEAEIPTQDDFTILPND
ncbi:MAG TPA: acylphosphatase [Methylophilaceae bacterium]|nr:acylphosphatase [Methylophilaceae bacterium]